MKKVNVILSICFAFVCTLGFAQTASDYVDEAKQGDAAAQYNLGQCYFYGWGVTRDDSQAVYWWKKAAEQGLVEAQYNLGQSYDQGKGVTRDVSQAAYWWKKAAEQGYVDAQYNLGQCYDQGWGVTKDDSQAVYWWKKAAEQGYVEAQYNLGVVYHSGDGVTRDDSQAVYWWKKAAEQGYVDAQLDLGVAYHSGDGVTRDDSQAVYWWKKAAEQGYVKAQSNLGLCYNQGWGVTKDDSQAVYWWKKAAEQGLALAQINLGQCYNQGKGVTKDVSQAAYWLEKAAEQGFVRAQLELGDLMYSLGNYKMAYQWYYKAEKNPNIGSGKDYLHASGRRVMLELGLVDNGFNESNLVEIGFHNGHEYVDLGLSVKWATCNVGATNPEDYGDYFAWGETSPKSEYTLANLKYCTNSDNSIDSITFSKYVVNNENGPVDNQMRLELSDDAARANWGGRWQMPTISEFQELIENCTWIWTTTNGKKGYNVVSKINGNSIFLPAAGVHDEVSLENAGKYGLYWSGSLLDDFSLFACYLQFNSDVHTTNDYSRHLGHSVRPVFRE